MSSYKHAPYRQVKRRWHLISQQLNVDNYVYPQTLSRIILELSSDRNLQREMHIRDIFRWWWWWCYINPMSRKKKKNARNVQTFARDNTLLYVSFAICAFQFHRLSDDLEDKRYIIFFTLVRKYKTRLYQKFFTNWNSLVKEKKKKRKKKSIRRSSEL